MKIITETWKYLGISFPNDLKVGPKTDVQNKEATNPREQEKKSLSRYLKKRWSGFKPE